MRCTSYFIVALQGIDTGGDRQPTQNPRKRQKTPVCKMQTGVEEYKIYSHDFCVHIHTQNTPTAGTNFF